MTFYTTISAVILLAGSAVASSDVDAFKKTRAANLDHPRGSPVHDVTSFAETSDDNTTNESIISRKAAYPDAGVAIEDTIITHVEGTFYAPKTLSAGSGAAWVGLDGGRCTAALRGGITWESDGTTSTYHAWFQWAPRAPEEMSLDIEHNHLMKVTISTTSQYSGTVTVENLTTHKTASQSLGGPGQIGNAPLCFARAEWAVGAARRNAVFHRRANLDTIAITGAIAIKNYVPIGIEGASIFSDKSTEIELRFHDTILIRQK